jgi:arylsulfate sulfotransferase
VRARDGVLSPAAVLSRAFALWVACSVTSCSGHARPGASQDHPPDAADDDAGEAGVSTLQALSVSTGTLRPAFDPGVTGYDVTSLNSVYPISVTATATDPAATLAIQGAPAQSGAASTFTLSSQQDISVVVTSPGLAPSTYTVHYVPSDLPPYAVTSSAGAGTEPVLMTPDGSYAMIVDRSGAPLYYRTWLPYQAGNFQQTTLPTGAVVYSVNVGAFDPNGWSLGVDHVMDDHFGDVADYQLLPYAQHDVLPAEGHEFVMLADQHFVAISYVQRTLDLSSVDPTWSTQAVVMSNVLQEIDHGSVLVEWDSANVPSLYEDSYYENQFADPQTSGAQDYCHLNSIDVDPSDGNFIVSLRHTSSIVKIDRQTAQILWTLGGREDQFGLTGDQVFSFQHHVRMHPDGSMTMFDNGSGPPDEHATRVVQLTLDQVQHVVTSFQVLYTKPSDEPQTTYMGSAVPLDGGRLFVGWGGWYTTGLAPAATEIVGGVPVWTLEIETPGYFSYRALPISPL